MSPVDSIRPPKRAKKISPAASASKPVENVMAENTSRPQPAAKKTGPALPPAGETKKQKTIITIVVAIMAVIFIGWVALFLNGKLTTSSSSNFGSAISKQLQNLWQTIKTDILKLKNLNQNANTANVNDEQIKKLENSVFPQFNDPSKQ